MKRNRFRTKNRRSRRRKTRKYRGGKSVTYISNGEASQKEQIIASTKTSDLSNIFKS